MHNFFLSIAFIAKSQRVVHTDNKSISFGILNFKKVYKTYEKTTLFIKNNSAGPIIYVVCKQGFDEGVWNTFILDISNPTGSEQTGKLLRPRESKYISIPVVTIKNKLRSSKFKGSSRQLRYELIFLERNNINSKENYLYSQAFVIVK